MSATATRPDSKSTKKRKAKTEAIVSPADSASHASDPAPTVPKDSAAANGDSSDSPYIKELMKYELPYTAT